MAQYTETINALAACTEIPAMVAENPGVKFELVFTYHGKERIGVIERLYDGGVVVALTTDGDVTYPKAKPQFKGFTYAKIESEIEVYKIS